MFQAPPMDPRLVIAMLDPRGETLHSRGQGLQGDLGSIVRPYDHPGGGESSEIETSEFLEERPFFPLVDVGPWELVSDHPTEGLSVCAAGERRGPSARPCDRNFPHRRGDRSSAARSIEANDCVEGCTALSLIDHRMDRA